MQALWCGVQIPENAKAGVYRGEVKVSADGVEPQTIDVEIKVLRDILADRGESDLWRMARLRWLNSQIGVSDSPTRDFEDVTRKENTITATDKQVVIGANGLPQSMKVGEREVLAETLATMSTDVVVTFGAGNIDVCCEAVAEALKHKA